MTDSFHSTNLHQHSTIIQGVNPLHMGQSNQFLHWDKLRRPWCMRAHLAAGHVMVWVRGRDAIITNWSRNRQRGRLRERERKHQNDKTPALQSKISPGLHHKMVKHRVNFSFTSVTSAEVFSSATIARLRPQTEINYAPGTLQGHGYSATNLYECEKRGLFLKFFCPNGNIVIYQKRRAEDPTPWCFCAFSSVRFSPNRSKTQLHFKFSGWSLKWLFCPAGSIDQPWIRYL